MSETKNLVRDQVADHNTAIEQFRAQLPYRFDPKTYEGNPSPLRAAMRWEAAILQILTGMELYAACHKQRYEDEVGDDGVFSKIMEDMVWNVKQLLNGETGRLAGAEFTRMLREFCERHNLEYQE